MPEQLWIAGELLGELEMGPESDFPWAAGTFRPSEAFARYEQYFEQRGPQRWLSDERLEKAGISPTDCQVRDEIGPVYLVALCLGQNGSARWRWSTAPPELD